MSRFFLSLLYMESQQKCLESSNMYIKVQTCYCALYAVELFFVQLPFIILPDMESMLACRYFCPVHLEYNKDFSHLLYKGDVSNYYSNTKSKQSNATRLKYTLPLLFLFTTGKACNASFCFVYYLFKLFFLKSILLFIYFILLPRHKDTLVLVYLQ